MPCDLTFPILDIYAKSFKSGPPRAISIPMFIAILVMIAKIWKQLECPLMVEWIESVLYP